MAKDPSEKEIQDAVNSAGRLAACLRDMGMGHPTLLDVLGAAALANVGLANNDKNAVAAMAWVQTLDDHDDQDAFGNAV